MYLNYGTVQKWMRKGKLESKITDILVKEHDDFISAFLTLSRVNSWSWAIKDITYNNVIDLLVHLVVNIILDKADCVCTGRIGVYANTENKDYDITLAIIF